MWHLNKGTHCVWSWERNWNNFCLRQNLDLGSGTCRIASIGHLAPLSYLSTMAVLLWNTAVVLPLQLASVLLSHWASSLHHCQAAVSTILVSIFEVNFSFKTDRTRDVDLSVPGLFRLTSYPSIHHIHPCCYKWQDFIFLWLNYSIRYIYHIFLI